MVIKKTLYNKVLKFFILVSFGTLAMFLVGGGLIAHNLGFLHDFLHAQHWDSGMMEHIANLVVGVAAGALACAIVLPAMKLFQKD